MSSPSERRETGLGRIGVHLAEATVEKLVIRNVGVFDQRGNASGICDLQHPSCRRLWKKYAGDGKAVAILDIVEEQKSVGQTVQQRDVVTVRR